MFEQRASGLRDRMAADGLALALITDRDSIYYFSGYYHFLYMEFARPSVLLLWADGCCQLIVPAIEHEMAQRMVPASTILSWQDGVDGEWREPLSTALQGLHGAPVGLEVNATPPPVRACIDACHRGQVRDVSTHIATLRMRKSADEIDIARQAGEVGGALMRGAREAMAPGVPEYEVALAAMASGTRKAAELLEAHCDEPMMSPTMHFLQIMASGSEIVMPHHRASTRRLQTAEALFMCFCGMTSFRLFKLGFDRTFWIGDQPSAQHERMWETAVASQAAALAAIRPGVTAESVHAAYADVIQTAGYAFPFRCGRATGFSYLEQPQLSNGDQTVLQSGMVFAVDGCVGNSETRCQIGDSIVVTADGYEPLTHYGKSLDELLVN